MNAEAQRLVTGQDGPWRKWGPFLSERQWGTVREDYSAKGQAWEYFPHAHARSRAYRWGEDGLGGYSDDRQYLCLGIGLWNGRDAILKERLFGLTNAQGNHGEDVKEFYHYADALPSHAWLRMQYQYPQAEYPYDDLVGRNRDRSRGEPEYELPDTGIFAGNRYFDVTIDYAKASAEAVVQRITITNKGPEEAEVHLLAQVWFRNTWSWRKNSRRPRLEQQGDGLVLHHPRLGDFVYEAEGPDTWLFTENETNPALFGSAREGYFKDAFHEVIVHGRTAASNPLRQGTKAAAVWVRRVPAGGEVTVHALLRPADDPRRLAEAGEVLAARHREADEFFAGLQSELRSDDERLVHRQAVAGLIWTKQFYFLDVPRWLDGDPGQPEPPPERRSGRNAGWLHVNNADIISMPDKWEYPWFAAWDLAFHAVAFAPFDADFAKAQLLLLTREWFMHPNGQLPAYEWAFDDVNPPVHAWATWRVYQIEKSRTGRGDRAFLERVFHKLMLNFTWWVNRKDSEGHNVFQGGFLGLDNIGVFDRSKPLPTGGFINQSDGTSWMAMYALNLMRIALELARENPVYQDIATKFYEHFLQIAAAMNNIGACGIGLWDEEDAFYYDVLNLPDGRKVPLKVRSLVGLIPLCAVEVLDREMLDAVPEFTNRLRWILKNRPDLAALVSRWDESGSHERHLLSLLRGRRMKALLRRMLDETEFLSDYGVRALSRYHRDRPYEFRCQGLDVRVDYQPAESDSWMFGGNSNWRGPIWMPVNYLLIESLREFHNYYGDDFRVEYPTGSGTLLSLREIADELGRRLARIFLLDPSGRRPVFGAEDRLPPDPAFRDRVPFYEYFHGDTGAGLGAAHQTGWTALVANLLTGVDRWGI